LLYFFGIESIMVRVRVLHHFLLKSILGFQKWTKKMSKNEKWIYFSAKYVTFTYMRIKEG